MLFKLTDPPKNMLSYKTSERRERAFLEYVPSNEIADALSHLNPNDESDKNDIRILNIMLKWKTTKRIYRQKYNQGRLYPRDKAGYILLSKAVRKPLYSKYYNEIDIINCHYAIIVYLMKKNGFKCDSCELYLKQRDKCLAETMATLGCDKNEAKRHFLAVLYGEAAKVKLTEDIRREVVPFRMHCYKLADCYARGTTVLSYVLQNNEVKFVCDCMDYLKSYAKRQWNESLDFVYAYDGFLCTKTPNIASVPKILSEFLRKMYDIEMEFKVSF